MSEENEFGTDIKQTSVTQAPNPSSRKGFFNDLIEDDNKDIKIGHLVQYALMGDGYIPTTKTIPILPSDCYKIAFTNTGIPFFSPQNINTDSLLRLPDSKSDEVIDEIEKFWKLKDKFKEYGFSHKRGFLLYGPPGSGKTSTISITIKNTIKNNGIVIIADHPGILSNMLKDFRKVEPERQLVVIWEDIDTIIRQYGETEVLSVLDGESQVQNVVFIATTNYPENLDGRIINRPSRFDKIVKIGLPNKDARKVYLENKLNTIFGPDGTNLVDETEGLSIAHLRELIVSVFCQDSSVQETLIRLKRMKVVPKSDNSGSIGL